jgi:hypothetical protein
VGHVIILSPGIRKRIKQEKEIILQSLQKQNDNVSGDHTKQMTTISKMITRKRRRSHLSGQQCDDFPRLLLLLLAGAVLINTSLAQTTTATAAAWPRDKKLSQGTSVYRLIS